MSPDERRRAIVEAVIPLLVEHGASVTTRQIAQAAGIAEGTIFRVFPDKAALLLAAAEATMDPGKQGKAFADAAEGADDLDGKVRHMAAHLVRRFQETSAVLVAVRGVLMAQLQAGAAPPQFVLDASRRLDAALTGMFAAHRDELSVPPETAALALRSLVFGSRHPMGSTTTLKPDEIADVLLRGVRVKGGT